MTYCRSPDSSESRAAAYVVACMVISSASVDLTFFSPLKRSIGLLSSSGDGDLSTFGLAGTIQRWAPAM